MKWFCVQIASNLYSWITIILYSNSLKIYIHYEYNINFDRINFVFKASNLYSWINFLNTCFHNTYEYNIELFLCSNCVKPVFMDHKYILYSKFLKTSIHKSQLLVPNFFTSVFIQHEIDFVFKITSTCIHGLQLFCIQIPSQMYSQY